MSSKILKPILGVVEIAAGLIIPGLQPLIAVGIATEVSAVADLVSKPKTTKATLDRLNANLDATAGRKILFGGTALATDVRYQAYTGTNQAYIDQIVACASHQLQSIDEIWFENEKAWTKAGGVQGRFAGYLTVTDRVVGTRANGIAIDATWTANATLTGCAYVYLRYKLTGNSSKATSPFSSGIPSRMTIRGKGMPLYDPRFDSTVAGGSGPQRANDQTTWAYSTGAVESGRNPALQLLAYLLGWRIQNPSTSAWRLAVGRGVPPARIDLPSFITAANVCDESVALAAGGTEPRYRSDGIFSEADDCKAVRDVLLASMNGWLDDSSGKLALGIYKNDLATPFLSLSEADVLGDELWQQAPSIEQIPNIGRGRYVDASDNALYQMVDYPEVSLTSIDGIDRIDPTDFPNIQSGSQVQRVVKQRVQTKQYPGRYSARFGARAWQLSRGKIVTLSHQGLGWSNKLFRVASISLAMSGSATVTLAEENAAIYSWSASETAPVAAGAPTVYDPTNSPLIAGIADAGTTAAWPNVSDPNGTRPSDNATRDLVLTGSGAPGMALGPNSIQNTAADGTYTNAARGQPLTGACYAAMDIVSGSAWTMAGLDDDATNWSYAQQCVMAQYQSASGVFAIYGNNNGTLLYSATIATGLAGKLSVAYDGVNVVVTIGTLQYKLAAPAALSLSGPTYPKWWAYNTGLTYTGLKADTYAIAPVVGTTIYDTDRVTPLPRASLTNDSIGYSSGRITNVGSSLTGVYVDNAVGTISAGKLVRYPGDTGLTNVIDNSLVTLSTGGAWSNGGGGSGALTLAGVEGAFSTKIDNQNVKLTTGGYLSYDGGTTATPGVSTRLIANDTIGFSSGRITNVGSSLTSVYVDNAAGTISAGKLVRYPGDTGLTNVIDNSLVTLSAGGAWSNGGGGSGALTLAGVEGAFSTKIDNQNVKLTTAGYLSYDGGTTATPGVSTRLIANDSIGYSSGKITNVGSTLTGVYVDNAVGTISAGKLVRYPGDTGLSNYIDNSGFTISTGGAWSNSAGGSGVISALPFDNIAGGNKPAPYATATAEQVINLNPDFQTYTNATGLPDGWTNNAGHSTGNTSRVSGLNRQWAMQVTLAANPSFTGMYQQIGSTAQQTVESGQYILLEADIRLVTGALTGARLLLDFRDSSGSSLTAAQLDLGTEKTTAGAVGSGAAGEYSWRKTVQAPTGAFYYLIFVTTAFSSYGDVSAARTYIWRHVGIRPATDMDIRTYGQEDGATKGATAATSGGAGGNLKFSTGVVAKDPDIANSGFVISTAGGWNNGAGGTGNITALPLASVAGAGTLAGKNSVDPSTSDVKTLGSIPPTTPNNSFSYTSDTSSVTVSWPALTIYRADGTTISVASGSQAVTGLSSASAYRVYPYVVDGGGSSASMAFVAVSGGTGSPAILYSGGSALAAATMAARGNVPLNAFSVATTSSGTGGGAGGGSTCFHEDCEVETPGGWKSFGTLTVGDRVAGPEGWQEIVRLDRVPTATWHGVGVDGCDVERVHGDHVFYLADGKEVLARHIRLGDLLRSDGDHREVTRLELIAGRADRIAAELRDPHLYFGGRSRLLSHNPKP